MPYLLVACHLAVGKKVACKISKGNVFIIKHMMIIRNVSIISGRARISVRRCLLSMASLAGHAVRLLACGTPYAL